MGQSMRRRAEVPEPFPPPLRALNPEMSDSTDLSALRIDRSSPTPSRDGRGRGILVLGIVAALALGAFAMVKLMPRTLEVRIGVAEATGGGMASRAGISANGYVVARTKASVSSKILGRLAWVGITEGSRVKLGETIARLESADYQAALGASRANLGQYVAQLAQARRELVRAQSLRKADLVADTEVETAQTKMEVLAAQLGSARAQVRLSQANLENTYVRAPFAGTVLRKDAEVGEIVAPSGAGGGLTRTAIVTMADLSTLEVEVDVNEAYIAQVSHAQPARITLDAYPDTSFAGSVRQVVPTADRQKATVLVKVSILDRDPRILPEMGAKVVFTTREDAVQNAAPRRVMVPAEAIERTGDATRVWVVESGVARSVMVDAGPEAKGQVQIRSGLSGGESLVLSPPPTLKDGLKVKVAAR